MSRTPLETTWREGVMARCLSECLACLSHDWDFFSVPDKHSPGGTPDCVLDLGDGPEYDGHECICLR